MQNQDTPNNMSPEVRSQVTKRVEAYLKECAKGLSGFATQSEIETAITDTRKMVWGALGVGLFDSDTYPGSLILASKILANLSDELVDVTAPIERGQN